MRIRAFSRSHLRVLGKLFGKMSSKVLLGLVQGKTTISCQQETFSAVDSNQQSSELSPQEGTPTSVYHRLAPQGPFARHPGVLSKRKRTAAMSNFPSWLRSRTEDYDKVAQALSNIDAAMPTNGNHIISVLAMMPTLSTPITSTTST